MCVFLLCILETFFIGVIMSTFVTFLSSYLSIIFHSLSSGFLIHQFFLSISYLHYTFSFLLNFIKSIIRSDMENVNFFTRATFFNPMIYPKVSKPNLQQNSINLKIKALYSPLLPY